jgi:hypothetical protein
MKKLNNILCSVLLLCFISNLALAGNEDRVGSAGASQLLVNPWARSTAFGDASVANASGIESSYLNIAGLTTISKTQLKVNHTNWLSSASIGFYSIGYGQKLDSNSFIGISIQSMSFGDVNITTVDNPDGGIGVFSPKSSIINFGYARLFTKNVSGGLNFKLVTESISNLSATGVAFDAGIKYTMDNERLKIGITLKNLGPKMTYSGDGLATQITYNSTGKTATLEQRSQPFEMPSLLNMGLSYDFVFDTIQKLSTMFAFTANSFSNDQYRIGLDYGFNSKNLGFNLRAGYVYEKNLLSVDNRTNSLTGFTSGFSMDFNVGKSTAIGLEYAARFSSPFGIIHTFGTTIAIK